MARISTDGLFKRWARRRPIFSLSGRDQQFPGETGMKPDELVVGEHIVEDTGGREAP